MDLSALEKKLVAAARKETISDRVPYAFEQRVMARIRALPVADAWTLWGGALWRAALPCVAVMAALGVWTMVAVFSGADNGALDIEGTLIANVEQAEQLDPMIQIQ